MAKEQSIDGLDKRRGEVAARLRQAREFLRLTQIDFASQVSISRERLASYEDGRAPLRMDIALRVCRQFFVSEFWLATGAVNEKSLKAKKLSGFDDLDARLAMALAVEPIALACPPGVSFADGFDQYLAQEYSSLARDSKGFPRITLLRSDSQEYFINALHCLVAFWKRGLPPENLLSFFVLMAQDAHIDYLTVREGIVSAHVTDRGSTGNILLTALRRFESKFPATQKS